MGGPGLQASSPGGRASIPCALTPKHGCPGLVGGAGAAAVHGAGGAGGALR